MPDPAETRMQRRALDRAFELAAAQVADGTAPFVVLGVADSRGVIRFDAFTSERAPGVGTGSICRLASITKPIVATAVMQLVEAGRFPLDVPLGRWLPELERAGHQPFTAWHVLSHTTGTVDADLRPLLARRAGRDALVAAAVEAEQDAPPGSRYRYVTTTFDLLVEAVSRATGVPFEAHLETSLLDPLGMVDTTFDPRPDKVDRAAPVVDERAGDTGDRPLGLAGGASVEDALTELHLAGGGLWSTASDLLRFGRAMLRGGELDGVRVLSPAFVALATREVTVGGIGAAPDRLRDDHYALGWGKPGAASPGSSSAFGHGGASGTRLWIDPGFDLVYVYLSGDWTLPTQPIDAVASTIYAAHPGPGR